ncbi:formyltransferase family protein [Vibrio parahaemolyticus]|uniref:formyltransferase family protein n=1 Tax=Vibrio parahaemolyticus TaxID=670 RepID=UPI0003F5A722|nr:formyltransferase family protein [Vibrio parahaemolyticus]
MKELYVITELEFHTAYLVDMLEKGLEKPIKYIVRNRKQASKELLDEIHFRFRGRKNLNSMEIKSVEKIYGKLSKPEIVMISKYGFPEQHALSGRECIIVDNLNSEESKSYVSEYAASCNREAAIFLDCILCSWWIEFFEGKIINAHSAILPTVKGMYAIEQHCLTCSTPEELEVSAGASIHYVDAGIDTGNIIKTKTLNGIWLLNDIYEIKASSYICAFELIKEYLEKPNSFSFIDAQIQSNEGNTYSFINYNSSIEKASNLHFKKLKEIRLT